MPIVATMEWSQSQPVQNAGAAAASAVGAILLFTCATILLASGCTASRQRLSSSEHEKHVHQMAALSPREGTHFEEPRIPKASDKPAKFVSQSRIIGREAVPPCPSDVRSHHAEKTAWQLRLDEAIAIALAQNRHLRIERYSPSVVRRQIVMQDSIYDPLFQIGGEWSRVESQVTNVTEGPGTGISSVTSDYFGVPDGLGDQVRLSKRLRTGGDLKAEFTSNYTLSNPGGNFLLLNPAVRSNLRFQVGHNLWQGVGTDVNLTGVRIAQRLHTTARRRLEIEIQKTILDTATAYWMLFGAKEMQASRESGVEEALAMWKHEKEKLVLGQARLRKLQKRENSWRDFVWIWSWPRRKLPMQRGNFEFL